MIPETSLELLTSTFLRDLPTLSLLGLRDLPFATLLL